MNSNIVICGGALTEKQSSTLSPCGARRVCKAEKHNFAQRSRACPREGGGRGVDFSCGAPQAPPVASLFRPRIKYGAGSSGPFSALHTLRAPQGRRGQMAQHPDRENGATRGWACAAASRSRPCINAISMHDELWCRIPSSRSTCATHSEKH